MEIQRNLGGSSGPSDRCISPRDSRSRSSSCHRGSFFLQYISENDLENLMWRLSALVTPVASERIGRKANVVMLIHHAGKDLRQRHVVPHDPICTAMSEKGTVTRGIFRKLIDTLAVSEEDESLSRVDMNEASGATPPKRESTAPPSRIQQPRFDCRSRVLPCDIVDPQWCSAGQAQAAERGDNLSGPGAEGNSDQKPADQDTPRRQRSLPSSPDAIGAGIGQPHRRRPLSPRLSAVPGGGGLH